MIVSNNERRIKEYRVCTPDLKSVMARAVPSHYKEFPVGARESVQEATCFLPENIKLDWTRDQLVLDVALRKVMLNQFDPARRTVLFKEPELDGYTRKNLADLSRGSRPERRTIRQTMPQPDPSNGIKLGRPASVTDEGVVVPKLGRRTTPTDSPPPLTPLEDLVGAPVPTPPPVSSATQAANLTLTRADNYWFER
jgi:hypothetical protein